MFCSRSIGLHLLKGAAALTLILLAMYFGPGQPLLVIPLLVGAVLFLRGCPMCWLIGLVETMLNKRNRKPEPV